MAANANCPDVQQLQRLVAGQVSSAELQSLEGHAHACPTCERTLATLRSRDTVPAAADPELCDFLAPAQSADELGRLGRYRVVRVLGAGGMGVVFAAEDTSLRRPVALKAMKPALAASSGYRERFAREARSAASLASDHIVTVHDVGEDRGIPFLAMELLEGESLETRLRRAGRLSAAETARIGQQAALGLAAAHAKGLVHRDVKPDNLWLENRSGHGSRPASGISGERVKILDFGIARADDGEGTLTGLNRIVGTAGYLSPEQARGDVADARSDLFSLGCVLYRCCTGLAPFPGQTEADRIIAAERHQPPPPAEMDPAIPAILSDLVMRLLEKRPERRPAAAATVADELQTIEAACHELPTVAARPVPAALLQSRAAASDAPAALDSSRAPRNLHAAASTDWGINLFGLRLKLGLSLTIGVTVGALLLMVGLLTYQGQRSALDHKQLALSPAPDAATPKMGPSSQPVAPPPTATASSAPSVPFALPAPPMESPDDEPPMEPPSPPAPANNTVAETDSVVEAGPVLAEIVDHDAALAAFQPRGLDLSDSVERAANFDQAVDDLVEELRRFLDANASTQIALAEFQGPDAGDGAALFAKELKRRLDSAVQVVANAPLHIAGRLDSGLDPVTRSFALALDLEVQDEAGRQMLALPQRLVFDEAAGLTMLGVTGSLPVSTEVAAPELQSARARRLLALAELPRTAISGSVVRADRDSPYGLEVLLHTDEGLRPVTPRDESGEAIVEIDQGRDYAVRLTNDSPHRVGVLLSIGGTNSLAFSENAGFRQIGRWVIQAGETGTIRGWHQSGNTVRAFRVNDDGGSGSLSTDLPPDAQRGSITAVFCAAWEGNVDRPADEPIPAIVKRGDNTSIGPVLSQSTLPVPLNFGVPRAAITVRYGTAPADSPVNP